MAVLQFRKSEDPMRLVKLTQLSPTASKLTERHILHVGMSLAWILTCAQTPQLSDQDFNQERVSTFIVHVVSRVLSALSGCHAGQLSCGRADADE